MKKSLLLSLVLSCYFSVYTFSQSTPATVAWPLTSATANTAVTSGQVTATNQNLVGLSLGSGAYTTIGVLTMQRCQMTGGWLVNMTERLSNVYVEYTLSPKPGSKFNVDSIGLTLAALSTTNLKADIFYSKDPTFATSTQITYNTNLANNKISATLPQRVHVKSLGLTVNQGETLYLRIYPWVENFPVVTTGKYLCLVNVEVGGTTEPLPVASSVTWPCSADLSGVVTGNMLAGTPTLSNLTNYGTLSYSSKNGVSVYTNAVWQAETAPSEGRYIQFPVSPKTGGTMALDSITFKLAAWATNDLRVSVYYSKDPSFTLSTGTLLSADIPVTSSLFNKTKALLTLNVDNGETVYFRFYPYSLNISGDKNKLLGLNDISVYGKVTGVTIDLPKVTTSNASDISRSFATAGGNISDDGGSPVTDRGIVWNTVTSPTTANNKVASGTGSGSFSVQIKNLADTTKIYARAYATTAAGTSYGNEITFTTLNQIYAPSLSTTTVSNIMVKTATSGGNVTAWGGDTVIERGICWSTTNPPTIADSKVSNGSGLGTFASGLTGLSQSTTYYVRAFATSKAGGTGYGSVQTFTTQVPAADVTKVVAKDGSGDYTTIADAFNAVLANYTGKWIIKVKPGTYYEKVTLASTKPNVYLIGENPDSTILTYDAYAGQSNGSGGTWGTSGSFSVAIDAPDFTAMNITFRNTVKNDNSHQGAGEQAVALRTNGDRQSFYNCKILGYQDTYYSYGLGRVYMKYCYIEGSVDFIFGQSTVVFDSCRLYCNRNGGVLTAPNTPVGSAFGYVFRNCRIAAPATGFDGNPISGFYLGRPWQNNPKSVYLFCDEPSLLNTAGWTTMTGGLNPLFAEYKCTGVGYKPDSRSTNTDYKGIILTDAQASNYKLVNIFSGKTNASFIGEWVPDTTVYQQKISFPAITEKKYGDVITLSALSTSGLPVSFSVPKTGLAVLNNNSLTAKGIGTVNIKASQAGNMKFVSAPDSVLTLTVTKATLTAKADDKTRKRGEVNPVFTITYTGFVNGDDASKITPPVVSCNADNQSAEGTYPITLSGGSADNYELNLQSGTLTVSGTTGISDLRNKDIDIFPNPATSHFFIIRESAIPERVLLLNAKGQIIIDKILTSEAERVDVAHLARGIYFIKLKKKEFRIVLH